MVSWCGRCYLRTHADSKQECDYPSSRIADSLVKAMLERTMLNFFHGNHSFSICLSVCVEGRPAILRPGIAASMAFSTFLLFLSRPMVRQNNGKYQVVTNRSSSVGDELFFTRVGTKNFCINGDHGLVPATKITLVPTKNLIRIDSVSLPNQEP